jgi:hypothetical protein
VADAAPSRVSTGASPVSKLVDFSDELPPVVAARVPEAGLGVDVAGEVVAAEVDAVADDQSGCGLVGVQAIRRYEAIARA